MGRRTLVFVLISVLFSTLVLEVYSKKKVGKKETAGDYIFSSNRDNMDVGGKLVKAKRLTLVKPDKLDMNALEDIKKDKTKKKYGKDKASESEKNVNEKKNNSKSKKGKNKAKEKDNDNFKLENASDSDGGDSEIEQKEESGNDKDKGNSDSDEELEHVSENDKDNKVKDKNSTSEKSSESEQSVSIAKEESSSVEGEALEKHSKASSGSFLTLHILGIFNVLSGFMLSFYGNLKSIGVMLSTSSTLGGLVSFFIFTSYRDMVEDSYIWVIVAPASVLMGLALYKAEFILAGFIGGINAAGLAVFHLIPAYALFKYVPNFGDWVTFWVLTIGLIIFSFAAMCFSNGFSRVSTAFAGTYLFLSGISYLCDIFDVFSTPYYSLFCFYRSYSETKYSALLELHCEHSYVFLIIWIFLFLVALFVQKNTLMNSDESKTYEESETDEYDY